MPLPVAAQVCRSPSASDCTPETPGTLTGPLPTETPSCAEPFAPQQLTSPVPARMAQTCLSPTATEPAAGTPGTGTGFADHPAPPGSVPSCQESLEPQHRTELSTTAQVVSPPAASDPAGQQRSPSPQMKKPGLQVKPQLLASHLFVAYCGVAQTCPHVPQLFGSVSVDTQAVPPQSILGKVHCGCPPGCRPMPLWSTRPAPQAAERKRAGRRRFIGRSRTGRPGPERPAAGLSTRRS